MISLFLLLFYQSQDLLPCLVLVTKVNLHVRHEGLVVNMLGVGTGKILATY